ncbi:MAG: restriction endonuclease [Victivallales bacterium]
MKSTHLNRDWRLYERFVSSMHSGESSIERTVIPNAKITGCISGVERQIDLLIDARFQEDISRRIIIDAKLRRRKIDVKDVESFEGMMKDCRAHRGILVCSSGYTPAALRRTQEAITIKILTLEEIGSLNPIKWKSCVGKCLTRNSRYSEQGWVLLSHHRNVTPGIAPSPSSIVGIGICDVCHDFNIWCYECGQSFALIGDEAEGKCNCRRFWLTAVEDEGHDQYGNKLKSVVLIVVSPDSRLHRVVDRRPLH